jgi:hypothetical protein
MLAECLTLNPSFLQFKISRFQYSWAWSFYDDFIFIFREEEACSVLYEFPWQLWLWISLSRGCARTYSRVQSWSLFFCLISFTREICFISFFLFNFFYTWDLLHLFLSLQFQFLLLIRSALSLYFSLIYFTHEICFISFFLLNFVYTWDLLYLLLPLLRASHSLHLFALLVRERLRNDVIFIFWGISTACCSENCECFRFYLGELMERFLFWTCHKGQSHYAMSLLSSLPIVCSIFVLCHLPTQFQLEFVLKFSMGMLPWQYVDDLY